MAGSEILVGGGMTELMKLVSMPYSRALQICIEAHSDRLDDQDTIGWSALHYAARHGRVDNIQALRLAHANPHAPDKNGETPADLARKAGYPDAAALLEEMMGEYPLIKPEDVPGRVIALEKEVAELRQMVKDLLSRKKDFKGLTNGSPKPPASVL